MRGERIELADGAVLIYCPDWVPQTDAKPLFEAISADPRLAVGTVKMFGKTHLEPRLSLWVGDPDACYTYSRVARTPHAWSPPLSLLRQRLSEECATTFNSVLINLYRDGHDRMGLHADDEPELGPDPQIASISLGATRKFVLKHCNSNERYVLPLQDRSLLWMNGAVQKQYRHGVPTETRVRAPRLNLTFRRIWPQR